MGYLTYGKLLEDLTHEPCLLRQTILATKGEKFAMGKMAT